MTRTRLALVALLLVAGFFAALPWLECTLLIPPYLRIDPFTLRACTFGDRALEAYGDPALRFGLPGFTGPFWGNLVLGIVYAVAAVLLARRSRSI